MLKQKKKPYQRLFPLKRVKRGVVGKVLSCIWCWSSSSETLGRVEYLSIAITFSSTLAPEWEYLLESYLWIKSVYLNILLLETI